jgi:MtN3 and saliva related transmembrane protein
MARRSSSDVSVPYLAVLVVGFVIYLVYGVSINNPVLIITNAVSVIATTITLSIAAHYRSKPTTKPRNQ